jgi:cytochrome c-type biogenesis protein CcmH
MIAIALAFVLPRLTSRRPPDRSVSRAALNADVYRGQLADLERERASGALAPADYAIARAEIERRLLAESSADERPAGRIGGRAVAMAVALVLPLAAIGLYFVFGNPEAIGMAPTAAQGEVAATSDPVAFRRQLAAHLAANPRDARALVALARLDMSEDRFAEAAAGFAKALDVGPKVARDADVWCEYADALGMAQGGRLAGRPAELIAKALSINPAHPAALEMAGSVAYEEGRYADAARYWKQLLADLAPVSDRHSELSEAVARAERKASVTLPR